MPRGDKSKYTDKQKRQAEHIEDGYLERGVSKKEAAARAWATVNQQDGGGKLPGGSGHGRKRTAKRAKGQTSRRKKPARRNPAPAARRRSADRPGRVRNVRRDRSAPAAHENHPAVYLPTREEIARCCREIQAGWTEATRRERNLYKLTPMVLLPVHVELEHDEFFDRVA